MEETLKRSLDYNQIDSPLGNDSVGIRNPFIRELIEYKGKPYDSQVIYADTTWHQH